VLVLLFLVAVIVIYISGKKRETEFFLRRYCSLAAVVLFKTECFVELGFDLLFPEGKRCFEQD